METKFKNVLITGASSGIGEAMALYYAASGSENLFICGRNKERLNEVKHQCEKFGAKVYASLIDVNDREKMRAWINQSNKKAALNLVLANAGVATTKENDENVYNTFNTNVFGVLNTVLPAVALFSKRRGKGVKAIAMLSSITVWPAVRPTAPAKPASKLTAKRSGSIWRRKTFRSASSARVLSNRALPTKTPARCRFSCRRKKRRASSAAAWKTTSA